MYLAIMHHLVNNWIVHTVPFAIVLTIILGSCCSAIGLLPFLMWLHFPAYLLHQAEEYIFPGGFKHHFNKTVGKTVSGGLDDILSDTEICFINVVMVWGAHVFCAVVAQHYSMKIGVFLPVFALSNAVLHVMATVRGRCYNPGIVTSLIVFFPLSLYSLYSLDKQGHITFVSVIVASTVAIIIHMSILLFIFAKSHSLRKRKQ